MRMKRVRPRLPLDAEDRALAARLLIQAALIITGALLAAGTLGLMVRLFLLLAGV